MTFSGSGGTDPDGFPLSYNWSFTSGVPPATGSSVTVTAPSTGGTFTGTLEVRDAIGVAIATRPARSVTVTTTAPPPPSNQPPNGSITAPPNIVQGQPVTFQGSATDENVATVTYAWNFGANATPGTSSAQNPTVTFSTTGTRTVTLTVTDSLGVPDPTPATVSVTVNAAPTTPPPTALQCPDADRDGFSPAGGACGPRDCNDSNASINPGAREICGDGVDNDCDGNIDSADRECNGTDCVGRFLASPVIITRARVERDDGRYELEVRGNQADPGAAVTVFNAGTGALLGTTTVRSSGDSTGTWEFEQDTNSPPCRVRVEINGASAEQAVAGAPSGCAGGTTPPPPAPNQPPVAAITAPTTNVTVAQGASVDFAGSGSDPDGNAVTFAWAFGGGTPASASVADPAPVTFNSVGTFTTTLTVRDSAGATATATRTVTVTAPPPPVANADSYTVAAGGTLTVPVPGVLGNDQNPSGAPLTAQLASNVASSNLLTFNGDGSFIYSPAGSFSGTDTFTYRAANGSVTSAPATVTITVTAAPPAQTLNVTRAEWDDGELEVRGNGAPSRATVTIRNASTGEVLRTTRASSRGEFRTEIRRLREVPCTIRVEAGSRVGTRSVEDAPGNCR